MDCYSRLKLYHLEHGDFCAESERQRDSLRHAVYLRVLCHRAAERPCYGRLLQDRFAYDRCNPGANGSGRHTNSDAYSQSESDADADANCNCNRNSNFNSDTDANTNGHGHCDSYTYCYCYCYSHTNSHCYGYSHCYSYRYSYRDSHSYGYAYGNGYCDCNTYTDPYSKTYTVTKASADSAAAPVVADDWIALSTLNLLQRSTLNEKFQDTPRTNTHDCAWLYRRKFSELGNYQHLPQQR